MGQKLTYLVGSEAYGPIMTQNDSGFGKGVCYDVPHPVFLEQKIMLKTGLTIAKFRKYVPQIEEETATYFEKHWGKMGPKICLLLYLRLSS
eukprot:m.166833 g.166833  ORF g.166833 m.166833 type:complete len:91 (+) comp38916_c0_seq19:393-665(+)